MRTATHVCSFTDKLVALHHGLDGHVEVLVSAVVLRDAAERIHDQLLLTYRQIQSGCLLTTATLTSTLPHPLPLSRGP